MVNWSGFVPKRHSGFVEWLGFDTVFHSVAGTFNYDCFGVVKIGYRAFAASGVDFRLCLACDRQL
jgi:hypothetical protein